MPKLCGKTPIFLRLLDVRGWDAASAKRGGNVGHICGEFIVDLPGVDQVKWLALVIQEIPHEAGGTRDDILQAYYRRRSRNSALASNTVGIRNSVIPMDADGVLHPWLT